MTRQDTYPSQRMKNCIGSPEDAYILSTVYCNSGYRQIEKFETDQDRATFASHYGLLRLTWMPVGLKNERTSLQRVLHAALSRANWRLVPVYLDDVTAYSKSVTEHSERVHIVLSPHQKRNNTQVVQVLCL